RSSANQGQHGDRGSQATSSWTGEDGSVRAAQRGWGMRAPRTKQLHSSKSPGCQTGVQQGRNAGRVRRKERRAGAMASRRAVVKCGGAKLRGGGGPRRGRSGLPEFPRGFGVVLLQGIPGHTPGPQRTFFRNLDEGGNRLFGVGAELLQSEDALFDKKCVLVVQAGGEGGDGALRCRAETLQNTVGTESISLCTPHQ